MSATKDTHTTLTVTLASWQEMEPDREGHLIVSGGMSPAPTWEEYVAEFRPEYRPHIAAIRACIEREGLVGTTGEEMANEHCFAFDDGTKIAFSWRAWGDLMQAIVGKREGYMAYYM
jgi:hypothetical protein